MLLVRTQYTEALILYFSCPCQIDRKPSKVGYFSKIEEIFMTALAAQTAQTAQKQKIP